MIDEGEADLDAELTEAERFARVPWVNGEGRYKRGLGKPRPVGQAIREWFERT